MIKKNLFLTSLIILLTISCSKLDSEDIQTGTDCNINEYANSPEKLFFTAYNGTGEESHGHYILSCSDGAYLQIGETGFIPNSAKILVVKTDNTGTLLWKREFSTSGHNLGNSAIEVNDGYLICGSINENSAIIKINKIDGTTIFQKTHDNGGSDAFEHLVVSQNGIVAVGYINALDKLNTFYTEGQAYLTFLDNQGERISGQSLNQYLSHAYRVKIYNEELIISGLTEEANDYALVKLDNTGQLIWSNVYGGANSDHCFGMDVSTNGDIFLVGHTLSNTVNWDTYTMKINNNGELIWETKNGNPRGFDPTYIHDEAWGIKSTSDGGCIIVAGTGDEYNEYSKECNNDSNSDIWEVYLIKYNLQGDIEWQKTYRDELGGSWAGEDIDLTLDGGAIIAVDNGQFGFLKIDAL